MRKRGRTGKRKNKEKGIQRGERVWGERDKFKQVKKKEKVVERENMKKK